MIRALKRLRSLRALYLPGDEIPGLSPEEEKRLIEKGYAERVAETKNDEPEKTVAKDPEPVAEKAKADEEAILKTSGKPETKTPRKRGSGKKGSE
jgi:hypothetical protein